MRPDNFYTTVFVLSVAIIGAIFAISGCKSEPSKPEPEPIYSVEHYDYVRNADVSDLNAWRQKHFDKHIVGFGRYDGGWMVVWVKNPGNSRQTFVTEDRKSDDFPNLVERLKDIESKYLQSEIVDVEWYNGQFVILLQDKLEPYNPSSE